MAAASALRSAAAGRWLAFLAVACGALLGGCARRIAPLPESPAPLRISDAASEGDPTRRASLRLVLQGLDLDGAGQADAARSSYERAIQIDPNNPYAYLALARHEVQAERWTRALEALDQAELLFGTDAPGVEAHVAGLRGAARRGKGYGGDGDSLLDRAGQLAPEVWGDGRLEAGELR